jgi:hypothetical protein
VRRLYESVTLMSSLREHGVVTGCASSAIRFADRISAAATRASEGEH